MTTSSNSRVLRTISFIIILVLFCSFADGKVIHVDDDGQADLDNIQAGIDAADDGDEVLVAPGEYAITEPITFRGKAITVKSEAGPEQTIIRMGTPADTNRGSVVVFESNETVESILDGFTITGGRGIFEPSLSVWGGGGILFNTSSGIVRNCTIVQNIADDGGGATVFSESSASLTNCIIRENLSTGGSGGVCCWDNSSVTMNYCTIAENTANVGGGVFGGENSHITMSHCAIINNNAYTGSGGMETWHQSSADVTNCLIAWNTASGLGGGGVNCSIQGSATIINSIICGNTAPKGREIWVRDAGTLSISYSDVAGGQAEITVEGGTINWGEGNIDADPLFTEPGHWADINNPNTVVEPDDPNAVWIDSDYHLKSEAGRWDPYSESWVVDDVTSPCIDRGDPNADWWGELWPHGGYINMGAYGGTPQASMSLSDAGNIADLNADNVVDFQDFIDFVDAWGVEQVLCLQDLDRDGIVGPNDLVIFADNCLEEVKEARPLPLAHWKLDEIEGTIAYDSALENDAFLIGDPIWQPDGGMVDGALEFDGINDYVSTPFVLNPADVEFGVFAWIKGGSPGQVILSQVNGANWLSANISDGALMTELKGGGRTGSILVSQTVITDDDWYQIGLTWDGANRILYVDDIIVAIDTQANLEGSEGGLYIGAGNALDTDTFFHGLIDDVRIYDRAITP